jgi:mono/diheme cytochrome c family protein
MATAMACVKRTVCAAVFAAALLASANTLAQGAGYNYLLHCGGCHIEDGSGMPPHVPDLRIEMPYFASFIEGRAYMARVPGVVQSPMTTEQLTQVLNLILSLFAPESANLQPYSVDEVTRYQQDALLDPKKLRDELMALRGVAANEDSGSSSHN